MSCVHKRANGCGIFTLYSLHIHAKSLSERMCKWLFGSCSLIRRHTSASTCVSRFSLSQQVALVLTQSSTTAATLPHDATCGSGRYIGIDKRTLVATGLRAPTVVRT